MTGVHEFLRRRPMLADALLAAVLLLVAALTPVGPDGGLAGMAGWTRAAGLIGMTAPLVWRRRAPLTVLFVVIVFAGVAQSWAAAITQPVALYGAVAHGRKRWRVVVAGLVAVTGLASTIGQMSIDAESAMTEVDVAIALVVHLAPLWSGTAVRALRDRRAELELRAAELRAAREDNMRRAVFEEQVRLARELHDVVAHHVSMIGLRALAARQELESRPDEAVRELAAVEESSRRAVSELYAMLGHLRRSDEPVESMPQPGTAQLGELVSQIRRVELEVVGEPRPLPRPVDVAVYRIVQEALTNTVKHAGGAAARVTLHHRPDSVEVTVQDDGVSSASPAGVGYGLVGMRERVALHGGRLEAGPAESGGFRVHAVLPTDPPGRSPDQLVERARGALRRQGEVNEVVNRDVVDTA